MKRRRQPSGVSYYYDDDYLDIYPVDKEKSSRCCLLDVDQFLSIVVGAHLHDKFLEYFSQHDENGLSPAI